MMIRVCVLGLSLLLASAAPVSAQDYPAVDVSGGYSFLRDNLIEENLHGWVASVAGYFTPNLGVVGEVGGNYKSLDLLGIDLNISLHSFMGGLRYAVRATPTVTPFAQVLAGGVRGSASVLGEGESATEFALQPGGGVDVWFQPQVGLRIGADYRRIFVEDEGDNEFRFYVGLVAGIGTR